jgi:beta-lactam-binding protein with PASTA domain
MQKPKLPEVFLKIKNFPSSKDKLSRTIYWMAFFVLVLLLSFFFFDRFIMPLAARQGKERVVPKVVDLTKEEAEKILSKADLGFSVLGEENHPEKPAGVIVIQKPEAGRLVKKGRIVRVTVSKGGKLVKVPNLVGISLRRAEILLGDVGLNLGEIQWVYSDSFPNNSVIETHPSSGAKVPPNISVNLVVNQKSEESLVIVPNLMGKNIEEAKRLLTEYGLGVGDIKNKRNDRLLPRTVLEQKPDEGEEVPRGTKVNLVLSKTD